MMNILNEHINLLNEILETEIEGQKLSIRQVKQSFSNNKIYEIKDTWELLKTVKNKIWGSNDVLQKYLSKDMKDLKDVLKIQKYIWIDISKVYLWDNKEIILHSHNNFYHCTTMCTKIKSYKKYTKENEILLKDLEKYNEKYNPSDYKNLPNIFNETLNIIKQYIKIINETILKENKNLSKQENKIKELENHELIEKLNKLDEYKKELELEKKKGSNRDAEKIFKYESLIKEQQNIVNDFKKEIDKEKVIKSKIIDTLKTLENKEYLKHYNNEMIKHLEKQIQTFENLNNFLKNIDKCDEIFNIYFQNHNNEEFDFEKDIFIPNFTNKIIESYF